MLIIFLFNSFFSQVNNTRFFYLSSDPLIPLKGTIPADFFIIIRFYAIMLITNIVHNKIISIICSCLFFCLANIYRPSLGKVQLGRPKMPNQN